MDIITEIVHLFNDIFIERHLPLWVHLLLSLASVSTFIIYLVHNSKHFRMDIVNSKSTKNNKGCLTIICGIAIFLTVFLLSYADNRSRLLLVAYIIYLAAICLLISLIHGVVSGWIIPKRKQKPKL